MIPTTARGDGRTRSTVSAWRAHSVGLYYLIGSAAITPVAVVGGVLRVVAPALPFWSAGVIGLLGVAVFALTVDERHVGGARARASRSFRPVANPDRQTPKIRFQKHSLSA